VAAVDEHPATGHVTAEPGSKSEPALNLLACRTATPDQEMDAIEEA
jgi:hypothetical protein